MSNFICKCKYNLFIKKNKPFVYTYILKLSRERFYVFQKMVFKVFYSIVKVCWINCHTKKFFNNCNFVCELEYKLLTCLNIEPLH